MASPQEQDVSPLGSVFQMIPQGHDKALKQAFYNTAATLFAVLVVGTGVAVYHILEVFLRPLLWAVLCGTFLHPFKHTLTCYVTNWLHGLRKSGTPLLLGTALLPLKLVDSASEALSDLLLRKLKVILIVSAALPCVYILYNFAPLRTIFSWLITIFYFVYDTLGYFHVIWVWTLVVAYLILVMFFWTPQSSTILKRLSLPVWIVVLSHIASWTGPLRVPLLLASLGYILVGAVSELAESRYKQESSDTEPDISPMRLGIWRSLSNALKQSSVGAFLFTMESERTATASQNDVLLEEEEDKVAAKATQSTTLRPSNLPVEKEMKPTHANKQPKDMLEIPEQSISMQDKPSQSKPKKEKKKSRKLSDRCFIVLFWCIAFSQIWKHLWLLKLLPILFVFLSFKRLGYFVVSFQIVREKFDSLVTNLSEDRLDVIIPKPIRELAKLVVRGDGKVVAVLEGSMDKFMSILIVLLLLVGTVLISFFMVVQIQRESMHLVSVTSNVVNNSFSSEFNEWLPDNKTMQTTIDSLVGNAYIYGREWIANKIHILLSSAQDSQLEHQLLEVYDQVYEKFIARKNNSQKIEGKPPALMRQLTMDQIDISNMSSLWNIAKHTRDFDFDIWSFAQENYGVFMSVMESVWLVLRSNLALLLNILTATLSVVFGGGTAIFNFFISAIIFITTLFYLLAASGKIYLPVEWFGRISPTSGVGGNTFGTAVEEAIGSVFLASLKMAAFYGLFTYFTHNIFGIQMVYIPAALASIFAAVPFVGTYWACLPAVIELWLVNGEGLLAVLLLTAHILPSYFVDTAIYSDIKGGHPYMTGLAIAGGMYWMGLEGAIIGPIVLVCLVVAVNVYGAMLKSDMPTATGR